MNRGGAAATLARIAWAIAWSAVVPLAAAAAARPPPSSFLLTARLQDVPANEAGDGAAAGKWLSLYSTGGTLKPPFNVRTETASNNVGPFLTGTGGYLQSLIYGLTGIRIREAGLVPAYPPALPAGWRSLTLRNLIFRDRQMTLRVARGPNGAVRLGGLH